MTWIFILTIALDQFTKRVALYCYEQGISFNFLFFKMKVFFNKGISFGLLSDSRDLLNPLLYLIMIYVVYNWYYAKQEYELISWNLILGGGLGNLLDRIIFKEVIDFIYIKIPYYSHPVFNIADIAITTGASILLYRTLMSKTKKSNDQKAK